MAKDKIVIPKGRRPEEFLNDERLVAYWEQELEDAKASDKAEIAQKLAAARRSHAMTASVVPPEE